MALSCIASQLSESEIKDLGILFNDLDKDKDGLLSIKEMKDGKYFKKFKFKIKNFVFFIKD